MDGLDAGMERALRWMGPPFICAAVALITMCIWVFVDAIFGEVRDLAQSTRSSSGRAYQPIIGSTCTRRTRGLASVHMPHGSTA